MKKDIKEFSEYFAKNYEKNVKEFEEKTKELRRVPYKRLVIPLK